jgi:hypothetical protein
VESTDYEAAYYAIGSIPLLLLSSNDHSLEQRVCRFSPYMFFRDGPRFKPSVAIIVINHDHDDHHCHYHHLSKELFMYSFFFVCVLFVVLCYLCFYVLLFLLPVIWLLN